MEILIIDDDPDDTSFFCEVVKEIMPSVRCVVENNYAEADLTFQQCETIPKLIFIDGLMFPVSGKDCLIQVKAKISNILGTKIIIYSGYVGPEQVTEFLSLGADDVKVKANNFESLKTYLTEMLSTCAAPTPTAS
jgi:DNA-binding NarL/FixJ family response regulator